MESFTGTIKVNIAWIEEEFNFVIIHDNTVFWIELTITKDM